MRYVAFIIMVLLISFSTEKPMTKVRLGERLFFEKKLSENNLLSCASCHIPAVAFSDTVAFSQGVYGRLGKRNTPSAMNMASRETFFYDGRASSLEEQARFPIEDHNEMNILMQDAVAKIKKDPNYKAWFWKLYREEPNQNNILNAIAQYERTLESSSPFDEYMNGDTNAISPSAKRGHKLFIKKENKCFECHFSPDFTGDEFRNIGLFDGKKYNDSGRYRITKNIQDLGKFKVPGLRNVAITMPYMHDGSMKSLKEVIRYYTDIHSLVSNPINEDILMKTNISLSEKDIEDIESFLISLTDQKFNNQLYAKYPHHWRRK